MKLLLSAVLVVLAVFATVAAFDAAGVIETWPPAVIGLSTVVVGGAVGLLAQRLLVKQDPGTGIEQQVGPQRLQADPHGALEPCSLSYRFDFVSTHRDLLDAHEALRRERTGMRPWVRGLVIGVGLLWLAGFFLALGSDPTGHPYWVWLALGGAVLWFFVVRPVRQRRAIRRENVPAQPLSVAFTALGIEVEVAARGSWESFWRSTDLFLPKRAGIAMAFGGGPVLWLPARVFGGERQRERFVSDVERRIAQEIARSIQSTEHPILAEPWTYAITEIQRGEDLVDVTLRRAADVRRLRFLRPASVTIDERALERPTSGIEIRALPHPEIDGIGVCVDSREGMEGVLVLLAADVIDLEARGGQMRS